MIGGYMDDRTRIIEEITKSRDYKVALFTTFNFEIDYFERAILNRLFDNGVRKISLFVDSKEFEKTLSDLDKQYINIGLGKKYIVTPVSINGAFHPKIVLLLGERKAKLIISSANIKTSGYEKNNEIYNVIDYSEKNPEFQNLIVEAIKYFVQIDSLSYGLDSSLINECKDFVYYSKCKKVSDRFFIGNYEDTIINQLKSIVKDDIKEIKIAVPYFDRKASAIDKFEETFPNANIVLYIQQKMSTFPLDYENRYTINLFDSFKDNNSYGFYHGKVFLFKGIERDYILYGSANCTRSALTDNYITDGNIECDLLDVGECGEFDEYFNNLHVIKNETLISKPITVEEHKSNKIRFIFAETTKSGIECHLKCNVNGIVHFLYKDLDLEYKKSEEDYVVFVSKEYAEEMHIVFDLTAQIDGEEEVVRCWVIDRYTLSVNRKDISDKSDVEKFNINSEGEKFLDDRINLLNAELMCVDEILENKKMKAIINQQRIMDEEGEDTDEDESFVVDTELRYEYKSLYRRYSYVERIRGIFLQRFLHPASFNVNNSSMHETESCVLDKGVDYELVKPRKATTEEKRFERFVKNRVKGMLNHEYVDMISFEHYLGIILVVTEIFKKYNNHENVVDIFKTDYVVKTKVDFLKLLLTKDFSDLDNREEYEEHIIVWALCVILENHRLIQSRYDIEEAFKLDSLDKELLNCLENKYKIRDSLQEYIKRAYDYRFNVDYEIVNAYGVSKAVSYIDSLYGYKNQNKLYEYIISRYGRDTEIEIDNNNFVINTVSDNIIDDLLPDMDVFNEVITNVRNTKSNLKKLVIKIANVNKSKAGHIDSIKHTISLDIYRKWSRVIIFSNGKKEVSLGKSLPN